MLQSNPALKGLHSAPCCVKKKKLFYCSSFTIFHEQQHNYIQNFYCGRFTTTAYCSTTAYKTSTAEDLQLLHTAAQLHPKLLLQKIYKYCILQHNCIQKFYCRRFTTTAYCSTTASKTSTAADLQLLHTAGQLHTKFLLQQIYNYRNCSTTASKTSTAADLQLSNTAAQLHPKLLLQQIYYYRILQHNYIQNLYCSRFTTTAYYSTTTSKTSPAADLQLPHTAAQLHPKLLLQKIYSYYTLQHNCIQNFYCRRFTATTHCTTTASKTSTAADLQLLHTAAQLHPQILLQRSSIELFIFMIGSIKRKAMR